MFKLKIENSSSSKIIVYIPMKREIEFYEVKV